MRNIRLSNRFIGLILIAELFFCSANAEQIKNVIAPEKFSGPVAEGYRAAQKVPDLCAKLFCYCGCDKTDEHTSLLDCFTSMHGVDCPICQEEAVIACKMKEQGKSLSQIRTAVDERFSVLYPWDEASPVYENYIKSERLDNSRKSKARPGTKYNTKTKNTKKSKQGHCCGH